MRRSTRRKAFHLGVSSNGHITVKVIIRRLIVGALISAGLVEISFRYLF